MISFLRQKGIHRNLTFGQKSRRDHRSAGMFANDGVLVLMNFGVSDESFVANIRDPIFRNLRLRVEFPFDGLVVFQ